jgi:carboxypeptidase Q
MKLQAADCRVQNAARRLRRALVGLLAVTLIASSRLLAQGAPAWLDQYREPARRIVAAETGDGFAWRRLAAFTDTFGSRLSGTPQLDHAIAWAIAEMNRDGLENVHTEKVMVPRWVRGTESAEIVEPAQQPIVMVGLGNSVGTPAGGIQAEVVVLHSFEELDAMGPQIRGRIAFFNVPFTAYGETVRFRTLGPSRASRLGAVAMLIRSVGPAGLRLPHTGVLTYASDVPAIPAAAITTEDADRLQRMADRRNRIVVRLKMEAHAEPDVESANVVGEIRGRERPEEVVLVGGHLDSWDVGAGASDDGGGCVVTWEALRLMKALNLRPRRTVRVVLFTNEENGARGALAYRDQHRAELSDHVMMLESDGGVFRPLGFGFTGSDTARQTVKSIATLMRDIGADSIAAAGGGADIDPSAQAGHVPAMSLEVDISKYFLIHHTQADTVDKIDPQEMARCAAAVAVMAYVIADLPFRLQ